MVMSHVLPSLFLFCYGIGSLEDEELSLLWLTSPAQSVQLEKMGKNVEKNDWGLWECSYSPQSSPSKVISLSFTHQPPTAMFFTSSSSPHPGQLSISPFSTSQGTLSSESQSGHLAICSLF